MRSEQLGMFPTNDRRDNKKRFLQLNRNLYGVFSERLTAYAAMAEVVSVLSYLDFKGKSIVLLPLSTVSDNSVLF